MLRHVCFLGSCTATLRLQLTVRLSGSLSKVLRQKMCAQIPTQSARSASHDVAASNYGFRHHPLAVAGVRQSHQVSGKYMEYAEEGGLRETVCTAGQSLFKLPGFSTQTSSAGVAATRQWPVQSCRHYAATSASTSLCRQVCRLVPLGCRDRRKLMHA